MKHQEQFHYADVAILKISLFCDGTHAKGVEFNNEREEEKTRGIKGYNGDKIVVYFDKYMCKTCC